MGLLTPDPGTVFWMIIIFGVVFFILAKYAFPVIIGMVEERKKYIDQSLEAARQANEQLAQVREETDRMLKEASQTRDRVIKEARVRAQLEAQKALEETRLQIVAEKESALNDIRQQVAILSVDVAEKILRKDLKSEQEQLDLVNRLIDEMVTASKK